jgi:hypothetical protein
MKTKVLGYLAALIGGSFAFHSCGGASGWVDGLLRDGFVDNRFFDIVTDWLWEDLLIG